MSNILGIDVSSYQGVINWPNVKKSGVSFAVLKVIRKDLNPDKQFEANVKGCTSAGVEIKGVYNYSYATTVTKAISDAKKVVSILGNRKYFVWLDVEDDCLKNLGSKLIDIIEAYQTVILSAGLQFGVYTGDSFYKTYIKKYKDLNCPLWIASYGTNTGVAQENKRPSYNTCIAWQFTSKGKVAGVSGNVDLNYYFGNNKKVVKPTVAKPTLKRGSTGQQVKNLQANLNYVLGCKLSIDGHFGLLTETQLRIYQSKMKIKVDGIYGNTSYTYMKKSIG